MQNRKNWLWGIGQRESDKVLSFLRAVFLGLTREFESLPGRLRIPFKSGRRILHIFGK